jgi:hypothetical protein
MPVEVVSNLPHQRLQPVSNPPQPAPAPVVASAATAVSLAAMRAELEADRAAALVERAALQARLDAQAAATEQILAMLAALRPAIAASAAPPAPSPVAPQPPLHPIALPVPHRVAVLDRTAANAASVNMYDALASDDLDEEAHEVTPHSHTRAQPTTFLPAAFVPTPSGTEQSAQQQLAAILNGLTKQGSKVKYATVAELDEALDDWATDAARSGTRTTAQVEAIRAYQRLLVVRFSVSEQRPLKDVLEYHRRWCKAVHAGTIDMFAAGAALNHDILYEVTHPLQLGASPARPTARAGKSKDSGAAAKAGPGGRTQAVAKHPAGSCANHPTSTTHTTAECQKK